MIVYKPCWWAHAPSPTDRKCLLAAIWFLARHHNRPFRFAFPSLMDVRWDWHVWSNSTAQDGFYGTSIRRRRRTVSQKKATVTAAAPTIAAGNSITLWSSTPKLLSSIPCNMARV